jgi:predicted PurR-regulated permease PerM
VLWGLVAFLLNFIPTVGSFIAAVPAVLLALVQLGAFEASLTLVGFVVVNLIMGNVLEPRWMGRGLNLSPLVVFVSLVLWGWVLGPVGMLLSIPLTIMLKIALESQDETRWIGVMMGAGKRIESESLTEKLVDADSD